MYCTLSSYCPRGRCANSGGRGRDQDRDLATDQRPQWRLLQTRVGDPVILAVEEINAAGGLLGHKVGYIIEDHKANAGTALSVARKLTEIDNVALISTSISPAVLAALPVAEEHHVFIMTPAQHPKILQIQAFTKEFEALGEKVVSTEMFNNGDQDMRGQLTKLKGAAPDLLNISATGPRAYGLVLKEAAELGYRPKAVIATDTLIDPQLREIAGDLASGIYYAAMDFDPKWNSTKFKPRFGYDGDAQAAMVYDGIKYLVRGGEANRLPRSRQGARHPCEDFGFPRCYGDMGL